MSDSDAELAAAQRSYDLRARRLERASGHVTEATAGLNQLFSMTFKYPDAARAKFAELVKKRGLNHSVKTMHSDPTDIVPKWKALRGEHGVINGPNREKELAISNLQKISGVYLKAEEAHAGKLLAERLLDTAKENLERLQNDMPVKEHKPEPTRQKRRLRQM